MRNLNNDYTMAAVYKNQALKIHKEIEFEKNCRYPVEHMISRDIKKKLYEMVS